MSRIDLRNVGKQFGEAAILNDITLTIDPGEFCVFIGRAIVRKPKVFLFDEPLSNLDAALRVQTRVEIAKLHRELGSASMVYVTHDQVEAMTLADKIVLLQPLAGRREMLSVAQVGHPL